MTSKNKILQKLENAPQNLKYAEVETLFKNEDFEIVN
jgi:hypothetical protein